MFTTILGVMRTRILEADSVILGGKRYTYKYPTKRAITAHTRISECDHEREYAGWRIGNFEDFLVVEAGRSAGSHGCSSNLFLQLSWETWYTYFHVIRHRDHGEADGNQFSVILRRIGTQVLYVKFVSLSNYFSFFPARR